MVVTETKDGSENSAVGDRRGLSNRTALVRIVAVIGFVLFLLAIILANLFYGFDGTLERLLVVSIGHLLLAPLAFIASLRLGMLVTTALIVAALVLAADTVQLVIRAFYAELSLEYIMLLAANIGLAAVSLLYLLALGRLRQADRELNNGIVDADTKEKRGAMMRQESNALRVIAIFDVVALVIVLLTLAVLGDFSLAAHAWTLLYLGHIAVIGLALLGAPNGGLWVLIFLFVALVQTASDLIQFTLRLLDRPDLTLEVLSLTNIVTTTLLIITAAYIIIDVAYIASGLGLISAMNMRVDNRAADAESQPLLSAAATTTETKTHLAAASSAFQTPAELHDTPVRRRK